MAKEVKYKAYLHKSGAIQIRCLDCNKFHTIGALEAEEQCKNCVEIYRQDILGHEDRLHAAEISDSKTCVHESINPILMEEFK